MKKLFFIVGLLSLLTFFSCQNEENVYYSCDEAEDAWVKENLSSIRKMETTEWFSISEKLKLPVYRAFSLEQKQSVWMEKLEDVMMNNEWKTEEIEHLQQLYDALSMHSEWLIPNTEKAEEDFDAFKIFTYKWLAFAQKELGWSNDLLSAIVGTANRIKIMNGIALIEFSNGLNGVKNRSKFTCNCNSSNVIWTTCSTSNCITRSCSTTNGGCGFLGSDGCDGLCSK